MEEIGIVVSTQAVADESAIPTLMVCPRPRDSLEIPKLIYALLSIHEQRIVEDSEAGQDLYKTYQKLKQQLEFLEVQEDYIKVRRAKVPSSALLALIFPAL